LYCYGTRLFGEGEVSGLIEVFQERGSAQAIAGVPDPSADVANPHRPYQKDHTVAVRRVMTIS